MKREKMYFEDMNAEWCYPLDVFLIGEPVQMMLFGSDAGAAREDFSEFTIACDGDEIELIEAVPDREQRACMTFPHVWIERKDSPCGRQCELYRPRNGKSGACRRLTHGYNHGDKVTFRLEAGEWKEVKNG